MTQSTVLIAETMSLAAQFLALEVNVVLVVSLPVDVQIYQNSVATILVATGMVMTWFPVMTMFFHVNL